MCPESAGGTALVIDPVLVVDRRVRLLGRAVLRRTVARGPVRTVTLVGNVPVNLPVVARHCGVVSLSAIVSLLGRVCSTYHDSCYGPLMNDNASGAREARSVRLSENEWAAAEAIAAMHQGTGAGAGLRMALEMARHQIIAEGDGEYGEYLCPASGNGDHVFMSMAETAPDPGDTVTCDGADDYFCGYSFTWRGAQKLLGLIGQFEARRQTMAGGV